MPARLDRACVVRPNFAAQQLHRNQVSRIDPFDFDRNIDQTISLHHGCQNPRALSAGRSNLKDPLFLREDAAEEVAPIRPLGKLFQEDRLHDRPTVVPVSAHF